MAVARPSKNSIAETEELGASAAGVYYYAADAACAVQMECQPSYYEIMDDDMKMYLR